MDVRERQSQAVQIEALIQEVAAFPDPQIRAKTEELLHALLDMYGAGLARLLTLVNQAEIAGQPLIETFARDELLGSLLLLHGLHPVALETRVHQALESVQSRGGTLELVRIENGIAYLRLTTNSHGCTASNSALKQRIENAIYSAAPDLDEICIEEVAAHQQTAIPIRFVPPRKRKGSPLAREETQTRQNQANVFETR